MRRDGTRLPLARRPYSPLSHRSLISPSLFSICLFIQLYNIVLPPALRSVIHANGSLPSFFAWTTDPWTTDWSNPKSLVRGTIRGDNSHGQNRASANWFKPIGNSILNIGKFTDLFLRQVSTNATKFSHITRGQQPLRPAATRTIRLRHQWFLMSSVLDPNSYSPVS